MTKTKGIQIVRTESYTGAGYVFPDGSSFALRHEQDDNSVDCIVWAQGPGAWPNDAADFAARIRGKAEPPTAWDIELFNRIEAALNAALKENPNDDESKAAV